MSGFQLRDPQQVLFDLGAAAPYGVGPLISLAAAGAGTTNGAQLANRRGGRLILPIDITVAGGTPTLVVTIQGFDTASGKYYTILASSALAAVATTILRVGIGFTAAANLVANDALPEYWRVTALVGGVTPAVTATVGAILVP